MSSDIEGLHGFEAILKEASPTMYEQLTSAMAEENNPISVSYNSTTDHCSRCGVRVGQVGQKTHTQWHRDLTYAINFQISLLQFIAEKQGWNPEGGEA